MFSGVETDLLPWAIPMYPIWEGSGDGIGYFAVPDIGTYVYVMFEQGSMYQPIYLGEASTGTKGLPAERTTNYPNRKVLKTSSGITFYVDDIAKHIKVVHPTGTYILVDTTGKVQVNAVDDVDVTTLKNANVLATQNVTVTATANVIITGGTSVQINPV